MRALRVLLALLALAVADCRAGLVPADPVEGEPFVIIGSLGFGDVGCELKSARVNVAGSVDVIADLRPLNVAEFMSRECTFLAEVQGMPAGTYDIRLLIPSGNRPVPIVRVPRSVSVGQARAAVPRERELDGNWFDPAEPGWGMNIVQGDSGALFAVWLTYSVHEDRSGEPFWVVMPAGRWLTDTTYRGLLYHARGSGVNAPFDPRMLSAQAAGAVTLRFVAPGQAELEAQYVIPRTRYGYAREVSKRATIRRFHF